MKEGKIFFVVLGVINFGLFCRCDLPQGSTSGEYLVEEIIEIPDSTAYYDSVYAPLRFSLDTFFVHRHEKTEFYGTVLFAERGRIIFEKAYGYVNFPKKDSLTTLHTFQLASASKPFTAVAILQLYEKGKLKLTDDVRLYLPQFPYADITIHQLLCHRSGLSQYTHFCDSPHAIWPDKNKTITNEDVLDIMAKEVPLVNYPPNQKHYYCNTNYVLLASIVEKVSGLPFENYLQQYIFNPAGMTNAKVYNRENFEELVLPAKGYNGAYKWAGDIYLNGAVGDKGVYASVFDMFNFDQALYKGTLLHPDTLALAFVEHNELQTNDQNYGYGFRMYPISEKGKIVFHTGWWEGFRTYFIRIMDHQQTVVVLTNVKRGPFMDIRELAGLLPL
jgi:CubicO group peptidase (beta-lactamase class C family)